jgi:hypothetical protein
VEIEVFHAALPLGLTCTVITRTVNRLSHVRSARLERTVYDMSALD